MTEVTARVWESADEAATEAVGAALVKLVPENAVILLEGDLGAGKTVLVRGMSAPLGIDRRQVQSPSYALIHEYEGTAGRMVHVDLYRLDPEEVPALGLDELLDGPGLKVVEWGSRLDPAPEDALRIRIESTDDDVRRIVLEEPSSRADAGP